MYRKDIALLFICLLASARIGNTQTFADHGSFSGVPPKPVVLNEVSNYLNQLLGGIYTNTNPPTGPVTTQQPPSAVPGLPSSANPPAIDGPGKPPGIILPTTPAGSPDIAPSAPGINSGDLDNIAYMFGVYQDTGFNFGAAVYTDNVTVQYSGTRDVDDNPTNLTNFRVIKSTRATDIAATGQQPGVAAYLSNENGTLSVGYPLLTPDGQNITVNYLLTDFNSSLILNFTTSVTLEELAQGGALNLTGYTGRKLLDASFCLKAAAAASAVCTAIGFPNALSSARLGNVGLFFKNFFAAQAANIRAGQVGALITAGAESAEALALVGGALEVAAGIYATLATACAIYKIVGPLAAVSGVASYLANSGPCRPAQGACDDNGNDDIC